MLEMTIINKNSLYNIFSITLVTVKTFKFSHIRKYNQIFVNSLIMCYQNINVTSEEATGRIIISLVIIRIWKQANNCTSSAWSIVIDFSKEVGCLCDDFAR